MGSETLAIHGGAPAIKKNSVFLRYRIKRGIRRSLDLMTALPFTLRGMTSFVGGGAGVQKLENAFRELTGSHYALAMSNGTATLHSAYFAVGAGPGREVIVPSYTWHATATPILLCGAVPVFCEIDPSTLTADFDDIERKITDRTCAICVLHPWGNPVAMDRLMEIATRRGLYVIEDCSHAHGAVYKGRSVGSWGHVGCFSLGTAKAVDGGEAGVATTNDPVLFDRMLLLAHPSRTASGQMAGSFDVGAVSLGVKFRPHLAAMVFGLTSLERLAERNDRATRVWEILCDELADSPAMRPTATTPGGVRGGFYGFVFSYEGEKLGGPGTEHFVAAVKAEGAPLELDEFRGVLLHTHPLFTELDRRELGGGCYDPTRPWEENLWKGSLPVTEEVTEKLVRFPPTLALVPESYTRDCARAVKKVLDALIPSTVDGAKVAQEIAEDPPLASTAG
jgi:dTDP-4-amino-4,6-dideoxygalactose transaminase